MSRARELWEQRQKEKGYTVFGSSSPDQSVSSSPSATVTTGSRGREMWEQRKQEKAVQENKYQDFFDRYNQLVKAADGMEKYYSTYRSEDERDSYRSGSFGDMDVLRQDIKSIMDSESGMPRDLGSNIISNINIISEILSEYEDYYGNWKDRDAFDAYIQEQNVIREKKALDLDAYQTELDELDEQILQIRNDINTASGALQSTIGSGLPAETVAAKNLSDLRVQLSELEKTRKQKSAYLNDARRLQEADALAGVSNPHSANYDPEFQKYTGYSSTKADNLWDRVWSQYSMGYDDLTYEYINGAENGMRDQILQKAYSFNAGNLSDDGETIFEKNGYDQMTEEEIGIYNYYYAKYGKQKAEQYLDSIQESLNYRKATAGFSNLEGNTGLEMLFGVVAGLDQFESGVKNLVNTQDKYIPQSASQLLSGMIREDLEDTGPSMPQWLGGVSIGQMAYDTITTSANMVPSILTSMAVGIINPGAGSVAGAGLLGASAAGNAYQEALNQGYDQSQARAYSAMIGASEAGLQYLLGGISKLGGKITGPAVTKMLNGIDNGILRTAAKIGGNMFSEGFEEGLQEVLTPWFESLTLGIDEDVNWSDAAYSFLLGAFTAGVMEGPNTVVGEVNTYNTGRQLQKAGVTANRLAEIGSTMSADSVAYRLAGKVDANTGAYTMGRMFQEIGAEITAQNQSDIQNELISRGVAQRDAVILANGFADVVAGAELTEAQSAAIEANDVLSQVVQDVIINPNSTVYQRSQGYNEILKSLANERAGVSAPQESAPVSDADIRSEEGNIPSENSSDQRTAVGFESESAEFSDEGRTILSSTGEEVTIQEIVANGNGNQKLRLEDGRVVDSSDVSFGSEGEALVYEAISNMGVNPSAANILVKNYDPGQGITANEYVQQIQNAYRFGQLSIPEADLMSSPLTDRLNDRQRNQAYRLGKMFGGKQVAKEQAIARKGRSKSTESKGRVQFDGDRSNLTDIQKTSISALETVADTLGVQIYLFESSVDENGQRTGANGWYDPKDGSIHIDLYAGMNGEGTMLFTAAHEMTHYIKRWSPAKFKVLSNFLMNEYGQRGVSVDQLVTAQMEKAERSGRELSYEEAYEEMIADSMESMLSDGNVLKNLSKLKAQDKSLWQKIKDFISDLAAKIKKVYAGLSPDSAEGRYVAQMKDAIEKLQDLFVEGLVDASSNFQVSEQILMKSGIEVNSDTESGSIYSVRDVLSDKDRENVAKSLSDRFGVTMEEARSWLTAETSMASLILNPKYSTYLDYEGDPNETAIKTNSDYPQGTVDFSNICKKRREFTDVMNRILRNFPNHVFAATDLAKIRTIMGEEGMTLPCGICYVEDRRQLDTIIAQDFIDSLRLYREGSTTRADGKPFNTVQAKALQMVGEDTYVPTIYELVSLEGRNKLKAKNPEMEAAWVKYNNARGMQAARLLTNEAEYKRQILKYNKKTVQKKNDHGGLRIYSFSDAEMFHLIDIIQVITDSAAVGLSIQGYTKVNEYAKAVKDTGEKLNRSLIPKGEYGYHMEDGKVVLDYDTVEGIDINSKDFFDNKDNPNVGNITIGVSDVQIRAAMVSDFVDQIIPFHTGQSKDVLREKGISTWKNYKDFQTEKDLATGRTSNHQVNIYTEVIQAAEEEGNPIQNKRQFVEKFLKVCKDNGLQPRFSQFLNTDSNGDFVYTEGYHKLLVDFKTFAQTEVGEYLPQMPVKPIFDDAYITRLLKDYVKEQKVKDAQVSKSMPNVIRRITDEIINADAEVAELADSNVKFSIREEAPPKKTGVAYKVFLAKDGGLYPPMVANPGGEATPVGVWLNADVGKMAPPSKTGRPQVQAGGKGTNVGKGSLAFRPGWHLGDIPNATQFAKLNPDTGKKELFPANFVWAECEYAMDVDYQEEAMSYGYTENGKFRHSYAGLPRLPKDGYYRYRTNPNPDTVPWVITGAMKVTRILTDAETDAICRANGVEPMARLGGPINLEDFGLKAGPVDSEVKLSARDSMNSNEMESRINYLRETISELEDNLDFAEGTEASQISRDLAKLNYELDDLIAKERRAAKKTPLSEILDRLGDYRISDLESLAEQLSEGAWDGYEDLDRSDLEEGIREMIEERGYTPIEMQNVKYGLFVRPVESSSAKILRLQQRERRPETVVKMLRDQNTKLQEDLQEAKELVKLQGQVTGGKVLNQSSIMAAAKYLKGQWEVSGDTREFASILKPFYNHILTGDEISWNTVVENAQPVVDFMIRNGKINMDSIDPHITKQDMLRDVYDSYWRVSTLHTTADRYSRQINDLKGHQAQKMDALRERKNQEIDRKISKLKKSHDERIQKIREEQRERVKRLQEDQKQALEKTREKYRKRLDDQYEKLTSKYRESRQNAMDSRNRTAMRQKVKKVVKELNDYLLNGTKDRHVPIELQKAVAQALDAVNMDTVGAAERIAKLEADLARAKTPEQMQEITHRIDNVRAAGENIAERLTALKDAYTKFVDSDDPMIANSYDSVISDKIESVIESVGNTALRDMTIRQLEEVYDMYRMVLTTVRNANKAFRAAKGETITQLSSEVMSQLGSQKSQPELQTKAAEGINRFRWNNLKPVYAFERIGSPTFTKLFNRVRSGEDTWAVDVTEARDFFREQAKKYNFDSWDFDATHTFESASGAEFSLSLQQIMSLYAFSKREQALDHLRRGGIVIDSTTEVTKKSALGIKRKFNPTKATSYNIKDGTLADIVSTLTTEQKEFADAMQGYLSTTMGAKGNEVSLELYGIKLFKEKNYFPLRSATQFMAKAKEQQQVDPKIKNKGFTKETVRKASNPIVLTPFMNVWAGHVNDMSMYHAFTLPMEDFYRVYNFKTPTSEKTAIKSVEMLLQNAHGKAATAYIDQLLRDLNGGVRADASAGIINKGIGMFKKGAVFASLSVVVQQPSAIARAAALIDTKYFIGPKVDPKQHAALWAEVKKYAPIAIIKEMGYFDTNMGMSTYDFITGKEYSGFSAKMKAAVSDSNYRDEILSKAPALADELAWCGIWEAVKRETADKNRSMAPHSDAFLKKCAERFTDVIIKTQVYDSVLARSALMRSKDTGVKMATSFLAEPTTSINMVEDALIKGKNGDKTFARRAIGSVIASQILNGILVSFVYAGRDDDDEKTYLEKYLGSLSGSIVDSLNPGNYIPFVRDIISIVQGYEVERSDMAVISDLWNAWKKLGSKTVAPYRKVEDFVGSIAQIFGLPVKNIMRDARGIYNTINSFLGGKNTTWTGTRYAIQENLPVIIGGGAVSRQNRLYTAIVNGDDEYADRLKGSYADDSSYRSAIRAALRANDPRIREAAVARHSGDLDEYARIAYEIIGEGNFDQDTVVMAINAEINAMSTDTTTSSAPAKSQSLYDKDDFATAIIQGDQAMANAIRKEIIRVSELNGKTEEDATDSFSRAAKSVLKDQFVSGNISSSQVVNALATYCGESREDAEADVQYWDFTVRYPDVYADDSWFDAYNKNIADYGIPIDTYMEYRDIVRDITGEGKKERRMAIIDSLPISDYQKDAMYYAEGWAESTIDEAPWR